MSLPFSYLRFLVLLALVPSLAGAQTFVWHLRGDQEVPPVPSTRSGGCMGVLDQPAATFELTCTHDIVNATVMHIHAGAPGVNGPILFDLGDPVSPVTATWTGMAPGDIADLLAGDLYINIHTGGRPDGEIRGQILPRTVDTVAFTADGSQVVPPNDTTGTASCTADLDDPATGLSVQCTHDVAAPVEAHVHSAPAGEVGPTLFTFPSPASPVAALVPLVAKDVADFAAGFLYLDIHGPTDESEPATDIRGQIGELPAAPSTGTIRIVVDTFPPNGTGFGFTDDVPGSTGSFTLDDGETQVFTAVPAGEYTITQDDPLATPGGYALTAVSCDIGGTGDPFQRIATIDLQAGAVVTCTFRNFAQDPTDTVSLFHLEGAQEVPPVASTARGGCYGTLDAGAFELSLLCVHDVESATIMHVHRGATGENGPIVFDLGNPTDVVHATWSGMTSDEVAEWPQAKFYINIHTAGRPDGEIRGQVLPRTVDEITFPLAGDQVVPPVSSSTSGTCVADLDDTGAVLAIQCDHDLPEPVSAVLHEGPAGENGLPVFVFPSAASPISGNVPTSPRLLADFAAGFLYVEIHSVDQGQGDDAIRGQLVAAPIVQSAAVPALRTWGLFLLAAVLAVVACRRAAGAP